MHINLEAVRVIRIPTARGDGAGQPNIDFTCNKIRPQALSHSVSGPCIDRSQGSAAQLQFSLGMQINRKHSHGVSGPCIDRSQGSAAGPGTLGGAETPRPKKRAAAGATQLGHALRAEPATVDARTQVGSGFWLGNAL